MPIQALVFDLDGTLVDTLADIADSMNHVLTARGLPTHPRERYRRLVGAGVTNLVREAAGAGAEDDVGELVAAFRARYGEHLLDSTHPYEGVQELLAELVERRLRMAVLSNKPEQATRRIVGALLSTVPFETVRGARPDTPKKPDPTAALAVAQDMGVEPQACGFVGDSGIDMQTARAAGMHAIGVTWGFRDRDELIEAGASALLDRPAALLDVLSR